MARLRNGRFICLMRTAGAARPLRQHVVLPTPKTTGQAGAAPSARRSGAIRPTSSSSRTDASSPSTATASAPWGVRGCFSYDGLTWDVKTSSSSAKAAPQRRRYPEYWHIGYPTVTQCDDGTVVAAYHQYSDDERPIQCMWVTRFRL